MKPTNLKFQEWSLIHQVLFEYLDVLETRKSTARAYLLSARKRKDSKDILMWRSQQRRLKVREKRVRELFDKLRTP